MTDDTAHGARLYAHFLGDQRDDWPGDLTLAQRIEQRVPNVGLIARDQREFVMRAVATIAGIRYPAVPRSRLRARPLPQRPRSSAGRRSFLPGGLRRPGRGDHREPASVFAVDDRVRHLTADVRDPDGIVQAPVVREFIDFTSRSGCCWRRSSCSSPTTRPGRDRQTPGQRASVRQLRGLQPGHLRLRRRAAPGHHLTRMYAEGGVIVTPAGQGHHRRIPRQRGPGRPRPRHRGHQPLETEDPARCGGRLLHPRRPRIQAVTAPGPEPPLTGP